MFEKIKAKIDSNEVISILCYCAGALFASVSVAGTIQVLLNL